MTIFAAMSVLITSATAVIYGESIWEPVALVGKFSQTWIIAIAMFTIVIATLGKKGVHVSAEIVDGKLRFKRKD